MRNYCNTVLLVLLGILLQTEILAQALHFRTRQGQNGNGNWESVTTWETTTTPNTNNSWTVATVYPDQSAASILIRNHTVTVTANSFARLLSMNTNGALVVNAGASLTIAEDPGNAVDFNMAGTMTNAGTLELNANTSMTTANNKTLTNRGTILLRANALLTNNGSIALQNGGTMNVSGTLANSGTGVVTGGDGSNIVFESGSRYRHLSATNGIVPVASWYPNSFVEVAGYTGSVTATLAQNWSQEFENVDINLTNLGNNAVVNFQGLLNKIQGNLLIRSTGALPTSRVVLSETNNTNIQIGGSIIQTAGTLNLTSIASNINVTVNGNAELTGGILNLSNGTGSSNLILRSDLIVGSGGAVDFQGASVNVGGNLNLLPGGIINNPGPIVLNGSVDQNVHVNNLGFEELRITKTGGTVNLTSDFQVLGTVNIQSATQVNSNGHLIITSRGRETADDGSIGPIPAGASIKGDVQVQRYMDAHGFRSNRYISIPVAGATPTAHLADDFTVRSGSVAWYRESTLSYVNHGLSSSMLGGRGYLAWMYDGLNPISWDVTGEIFQGPRTLPMTYSASDPNNQSYGWNLLGNPYASAIRWTYENAEESGWEFSEDISPIIYITDMGSNAFIPIDPSEELEGSTNVISMGQAFWVKANAPNPSMTIHEAAKVTTANAGRFYRNDNTVRAEKLIIQLNKDNQADLAVLKVNEQSTHEFDFRFDAHKLRNEQMNIYFIEAGGKQLGLNSIPEITYDERIYMGLEVAEPGEYQISFRNLETFSQADAMYLIDSFRQSNHMYFVSAKIPMHCRSVFIYP
jgi:trimeric autotransporter adhesin